MEGPDRFVEFVDRLAADLDGPPVGTVELAARAHLSRSHFDRVIQALAGESPARFRNRIMLERSAYRMLVTDVSLLDIAVAAGFSSHEAFTRAFRRAYGVAPSVWRRRPTRYQIPAPNGVHFHPPAGLRLPARQSMGDMELIVRMVEHHVWLIEQLVDRAGRLTDEQLDAPLDAPIDGIDGESLRWLLSRLIGQMGMWNAAMLDREYDFHCEVGESVAAMRDRLRHTGSTFIAQVRRVAAEERYDETFVDAFTPEPMIMTYGAMVAHVLTYAAHHRLLAVTQLRGYGMDDLGFGDPKQWFNPPVPTDGQRNRSSGGRHRGPMVGA